MRGRSVVSEQLALETNVSFTEMLLTNKREREERRESMCTKLNSTHTTQGEHDLMVVYTAPSTTTILDCRPNTIQEYIYIHVD